MGFITPFLALTCDKCALILQKYLLLSILLWMKLQVWCSLETGMNAWQHLCVVLFSLNELNSKKSPFCNKQWWALNVMWIKLITAVTVEAEKDLRWIKSLLCEWTVSGLAWDCSLFWHDRTRLCVCVCVCVRAPKFALSYTWIRTPNPTRLAFQRGGHLLETSAPFRLSWSTYWTVPRISTHLSEAWTCSLFCCAHVT